MSLQLEEKQDIQHVEDIDSTGSKGSITLSPDKEEIAEEDDFSDVDEKAVMRKIDWHLLPMVALLYLLSYMDRSNIGNAKIEGLVGDLNMTETQFNNALMIFFISYSACEIPSNMILKKIGRQSAFLATIMLLWGICMTCMGTVQNFGQLFTLRLLLGIFEAGLYPGVTYGLTMYYKRSDMLSRQAIFYCGASSAGAFSGLLAFAIAKMDGVGGYEGWRWIFILEGLLTVVVAGFTYYFLIDYPKDCKFLTQREKDFINWRLKNDNNTKTTSNESEEFVRSARRRPIFTNFTESNDINMKQALLSVFRDWQVYLFVLMYWGVIIPIYAVSMYLPSVVKALGYSSSSAQLMTIPVYVIASIVTVCQSFVSDKAGKRSPFVAFDLLVSIGGLIMMVVGQKSSNTKVIYAGCYLAAVGATSQFPTMITWYSNNLSNSKRRAIGIAAQIGLGNFGGVVASHVYKPSQLLRGHIILLGCIAFAEAMCVLLIIGYNLSNKRDIKRLEAGLFNEVTDEELYRMGDKSPFYLYRL